ncbi:MAG: CBS domain-containing protein [Candidatus Micrarchaeota archaeon]|nr:CBS domain-containing protein [Candidatus Micrarchaeota archaeon]
MELDLRIGDYMTKGVITLDQSKTVFDAAKILSSKKIGCIIVTEKGDAVGILTERDIVSKIVAKAKNPKQVKLSEVMSKPLKAIYENQTIQDAALAMRENNIKRLAVLDKKNKLVGIITQGDLIAVYPGIIDILSQSPQTER